MRARRREVAPETREELSEAFCEAVWARADVQAAVAAKRPFAVYLANDEEIDLMPLVERLWAEGVTVAVPYWHVEARTYRLAIYTNATTLIEGFHGIMEPAEVYEIATEDVGVWIVPGLAFTRDGRRLGYGGGWFDRYLAAAAPDALTLAAAYPFQMLDELPVEAHDRRVTAVVLGDGYRRGGPFGYRHGPYQGHLRRHDDALPMRGIAFPSADETRVIER